MLTNDQTYSSGMRPDADAWAASLWFASEVMIVIACCLIPVVIALVIRHRPESAHRRLLSTFAALLLTIGLGQGLDIWGLWYRVPGLLEGLLGALKLGSVALFLALAYVLIRRALDVLRLPTQDRHDAIVEQLEVALADLSQTCHQLERRVKRRTGELEVAKSQLARTARETVQRNRNLIHVVSSLVDQPGEDSANPEGFLRALQGRVNALTVATAAVVEQDEPGGVSLEYVIMRQLEPLFASPRGELCVAGPPLEIGTQGAQQLTLIVWELGARFAQMGHPEQARGRVALSWDVNTQAGCAAEFTLEWCETFVACGADALDQAVEGDGTYTPEPLANFSETLLRQTIPRLLDGKGRVDIAPATFIYRLTCPLSMLDDPGARPKAAIRLEVESQEPCVAATG